MRPDIDSSPTPPLETNAFVVRNGESTGPIALPDKKTGEFVRLFNQTYVGLRMQIQQTPLDPPPGPECVSVSEFVSEFGQGQGPRPEARIERENPIHEKNVGLLERIRRFIVSLLR
jgi:hypothetical protein